MVLVRCSIMGPDGRGGGVAPGPIRRGSTRREAWLQLPATRVGANVGRWRFAAEMRRVMRAAGLPDSSRTDSFGMVNARGL